MRETSVVLPEPVDPTIATVSPRFASKRDALHDRRFGAGVGELHLVERDRAGRGEVADRVRGAGQGGLARQHLADALGRDGGARDHDRHEARHQHAHEDLTDVLHEGEEGSDLDRAGVHLDRAEPDDPDDRDVEHEHRDREQQHEERADLAADHHDVGVRHREALLLDVLADERPHHAHAGELLAHDAVDGVELLLEAAEERNHPADDEQDEQRAAGAPTRRSASSGRHPAAAP